MVPRNGVLAAVVLGLSACASGAGAHGRLGAPQAAHPPRGARAEFDPAAFDLVFVKAMGALRARGFVIVACDPELGAIATAPAEGDAPCLGSTCLVRETVSVKLGYRRARVTVNRELWDATLRAWRVADDAVSAQGIARQERELIAAAVRPGSAAAGWESGAGAAWNPGACGATACEPGACLAASGVPLARVLASGYGTGSRLIGALAAELGAE